jgi:hypothetical protein
MVILKDDVVAKLQSYSKAVSNTILSSYERVFADMESTCIYVHYTPLCNHERIIWLLDQSTLHHSISRNGYAEWLDGARRGPTDRGGAKRRTPVLDGECRDTLKHEEARKEPKKHAWARQSAPEHAEATKKHAGARRRRPKPDKTI